MHESRVRVNYKKEKKKKKRIRKHSSFVTDRRLLRLEILWKREKGDVLA